MRRFCGRVLLRVLHVAHVDGKITLQGAVLKDADFVKRLIQILSSTKQSIFVSRTKHLFVFIRPHVVVMYCNCFVDIVVISQYAIFKHCASFA
ncbi:MAG: hypothetical protein ACI84R_001012 [Candidatus Azotimanducaceae bacterium]|jgi:hypothetical protein